MSDVQTAKLKVEFKNPREGNKPASIKSDGKYWSMTDEDYAKVKEGETYHFTYKTKAGTGKWSGRTFLDITGIIASDSSGGNGHAATAPARISHPHDHGQGGDYNAQFKERAAPGNGQSATNRERRITELAVSKFVAPIPFSDRETMCNQMTEILFAASDAYDRVYGSDGIPF